MKYYEVVHSYNVAGGHNGIKNGDIETNVVATCTSRDVAEQVVNKYSRQIHWIEKGNSAHDIKRSCGELSIVEKELSDTMNDVENNINAWWLRYDKYDGQYVNYPVHSRLSFSWKNDDIEINDGDINYGKPIKALNLSVRAYNCLMRAGITTIDRLCDTTQSELLKIRNMGLKSSEEILSKLKENNLSLKEE